MKRNLILLIVAVAAILFFEPAQSQTGTITFAGSVVVSGCTTNCTQTVSTVPLTTSDAALQYYSNYTNGQGEVLTIVYE